MCIKIMHGGEDLDLDHPDHHMSQGHNHIQNRDPDPDQIGETLKKNWIKLRIRY